MWVLWEWFCSLACGTAGDWSLIIISSLALATRAIRHSPAIRISSDLSCVNLVLKNISMLWLLPGFNLIFDICCFRGFDLFSYFCCFSARESGIPKNRVWLRTMHSAHDALPVPSWSFLISILLLWIYPVHMLVIYIYLFILFKHICLVLYFLLLDYIYIFFLYKVIFA
jgi:hypothetical protein